MKKAVIFDLEGVLVNLREGGLEIIEENFEFAKNLRENYKLGILSNLSAEYVDDLRREGFYDVFSEIHLSGETGLSKPGREAYLLILERMSVSAQEAIFIDDSPENVRAAREVGMETILFTEYGELVREFEEKENPLV